MRCLIVGPPKVLSTFKVTCSQLTFSNNSSTLACFATTRARLPNGTDWNNSNAKPPGLISAASQTQPLLSLITFSVSSTPYPTPPLVTNIGFFNCALRPSTPTAMSFYGQDHIKVARVL